MVSILDLLQSFKLKPKPKFECVRKMSREPQILAIFVPTLCDKNWPSYASLKIRPTFGPGDVTIDDVTSMYVTNELQNYMSLVPTLYDKNWPN